MNKKVATARMVTSILVVTLAGAMSRAHSADTSASVPGAASDKDLEEIVVTGYRASLNLADLIKKDDPNVVDSIVAQDIGKLPDTTVGDALQRVGYGAAQIVGVIGFASQNDADGDDGVTALL